MEEDIKILEEQLNAYKRHLETYEKEDCLTSVYYELKKYATALENLIKGYRELGKHIAFYEKHGSYKKRIIELKEENEELKEQVEYLKHEVVLHGSTVEKLVREKMNSIPKSKIKEKIEELNGMIYLTSKGELTKYTVGEIILANKILQELMEDK